jgi:hypothetical protein
LRMREHDDAQVDSGHRKCGHPGQHGIAPCKEARGPLRDACGEHELEWGVM